MFIPDIGGIIFNIVPMSLFLSLSNGFAGDTQYSTTLIAGLFIVSLGLLLIPFRLFVVFAHLFKLNLDVCGTFSVAIIGGLSAGCLFYLLIPSHFFPDWIYLSDYALLGVIQSIIAQTIFKFIPEEWKLKLEE